MKKILVLKMSNLSENTSSNIRTLNLIDGLCLSGNQVDVVSLGSNFQIDSSLSTRSSLRFIDIDLKNEIYEKVKSGEKESFLKKWRVNLLRKIYHDFFIYDNSYFLISKIGKLDIRKNYDIIISISDPKTSHLLAEEVIKNIDSYKKWIQYWGDPLAKDINKGTIYPKIVLKYFERRILEKADKIIYVSPFTLEEQKEYFPKISKKMFFLPVPSSDEKEYPPVNNSKYIISYSGAYNKSYRNIIPLYNAINEHKDEYDLVITGDSDIVLENRDNIVIQPRGEIESIEKQSDLLICIINNKGYQIPSKLYYMASTNKPILVLLDGPNKDLIREYLSTFNRFYFCDNHENEIRKKIKEILKLKKTFAPSELLKKEIIAEKMLKL